MGTFIDYAGDNRISAHLQAEFNEHMLKILNYGGMMQLERINMFDQELHLLKPLKLSTEGKVSFYFNYFEDDSWESAGYDAQKTYLWSGKVGSREFCDVMLAAYMLYEIYSEGIGFALINGEMVEADTIIGWFNQLFGTEYSLEKRFRSWESAEICAYRNEDYGAESQRAYVSRDFDSLLSNPMLMYAGGTELADVCYVLRGTTSLTEDSVQPGTYPETILACRQKLAEYLQQSTDKENALSAIWALLAENREQRNAETGPLAAIAQATLALPAHLVAFLTTELLEKDFWKEWKTLRKRVYHDEIVKTYATPEVLSHRQTGRVKSVPKVRTSDFLRQDNCFIFRSTPEELRNEPRYFVSDADRLYWWDGSDEVRIDEDTDKWLQELAKRHRELLTNTDEDDKWQAGQFLPNFLELLHEIDAFYKRILPFKSMFYDFVEHSQQPEYKAAVLLLQEVAEDWKLTGKAIKHLQGSWEMCSRKVTFNSGRVRMKRYLSIMANLQLRRKYFAF